MAAFLIGYGIVLGIPGYFLVRYLIRKENAKSAREAEEAARQRGLQQGIVSACSNSAMAFQSIPKDLMSAEQLLDTAEAEFKDGAFSPFWDSIERAMRNLGTIDGNIKLIADLSDRYKNLIKSYKSQPPQFPVDPSAAQRLGTATNTASRLQRIVHTAQRNFQFATIYEQRKTSQILIAGFTTLGDAISGLGRRLEESIGLLGDQISQLSSSVNAMGESVVESVKGVSSKVGELSPQVANIASEMTVANRMLDNMQRRRVPPAHEKY
jgi:hypothetical protein